MRNRLVRSFLIFGAIWLTTTALNFACQAMGSDHPASSKSVDGTDMISPTVEVRDFEVHVDKTLRGTHRLTIKSDGESETAQIHTDVSVNLIVYVYAFKSRGTEVWRDGRLVSSDIRSDDNGKKRAFLLKPENSIQQISFNEKPLNASAESVMSTAYWHLPSAEIRSKPLSVVDVDSGKTFRAKLTQVGKDSVTVGGRAIACWHFRIDGVSPADLWFDENDRLVQQKSTEQGHATELRLVKIRSLKEKK